MLNRILILSIVFIATTFFKCEDDNIVNPPPTGTYTFASFDQDGNKLVEGEFSVVYNDAKSFKGQWEFSSVENAENPRPQIGKGELVGEIRDNNVIYIDLNPGWADNNAYLNGTFENGNVQGEWSWVGFTGVPEKGTFTAKEK